jgi:hypothetical protein
MREEFAEFLIWHLGFSPRMSNAFLLKCTGDSGKGVVRIGADESDCADYKYEDYSQHHSVFGNILALLIDEEAGKILHFLGNSFHLNFNFGWVTLKGEVRSALCERQFVNSRNEGS